MRASVTSVVLTGVEAIPCRVEVALLEERTPKTTIVGLPDAAVRESIERVRAAMAACALPYPPGRVTISLAPAALKKEGPRYDLPMAIALLIASGHLGPDTNQRMRDIIMVGELALDGSVKSVRGAVAVADLARQQHIGEVILPESVAGFGALVSRVRVLGVSTLMEAVQYLTGRRVLKPAVPVPCAEPSPLMDLENLRGQRGARRALLVAAAGWHNLLMVGPPGAGKTTLARCLPGILPSPQASEALELARIASIAGTDQETVVAATTRPFRAPHHTASAASIVGGGAIPMPGEITLAHRGVLFLDELPEFQRGALEALREPLERDEVVIARASGRATYPAHVLMVGAMNPTRQGRGRPGADGSLKRLSGPLLDRIDLHVEVPAVPVSQLSMTNKSESSSSVRELVTAAWQVQRKRQGVICNGRLTTRQLDELAPMTDLAGDLLHHAVDHIGLSARGWDRIRRISRTLADLESLDVIEEQHVAEALQYRWLDRI